MDPSVDTRDLSIHSAAPSWLQGAEPALEEGRYCDAGALAARAVANARLCNDAHLLGWSLMIQGRLYRLTGKALPAYTAATAAYRLLEECGDTGRQLWALNTCATSHSASGDWFRAVELWRRGLQLARGPECSAVRCVMLSNLAETALGVDAGYAEAIECLVEAAELARCSPQRRGQWEDCASELAFAYLRHADHLRRSGQADEASAQLIAAARALPPLHARQWRSLSMLEYSCMRAQTEVLAGLSQWRAARSMAAAQLGFARSAGSGALVRAQALVSLAALYRRSGHLHRSIRYECKVLALCAAHGEETEHANGLQRLSELQACAGAHDHALALRKQLAAQQDLRKRSAGALRCRLATIERRAERHRLQLQEALARAERLAIIGRLIAQTHHALSGPITQARQLTVEALAARPDALQPLLTALSGAIDRAAGLVSQLKLFSYRSSPQPMALSLHESLLDAWRGLDPHIGSRTADLRIAGQTQLQVWGDAQRLGIMLKVLLIELTQQARTDGPPLVIGVRIDCAQPHTVLLHIHCGGCSPGVAAAAATVSLGAALCMEIAAEIHGELQPASPADEGLHYRLRLPEAGTRVHPGPGGPA